MGLMGLETCHNLAPRGTLTVKMVIEPLQPGTGGVSLETDQTTTATAGTGSSGYFIRMVAGSG